MDNNEIAERIEGLLAQEEGVITEAPQEEKEITAQQSETQDSETEQPTTEVDSNALQEEEKTTETTEEIQAQSLNDLVDFLKSSGVEVDASDIYNLTIPVNTPDGRGEITIGEWKDGYQEAERAKAQAKAEIEKIQAQQVQFAQQQQLVGRRLQELDAMAMADEQSLKAEAEKVDWNDLRENDPAEFAAKRRDFDERWNGIQQRRQSIAAHVTNQMNVSRAQQDAQMRELLEVEAQRTLEKIPEWKDASVQKAETDALVKYLQDNEYAMPEIEAIRDHRATVLMRKAMLYDQMKKSDPTPKKVIKFGKRTLKPGPGRSTQQLGGDAYREDLKKARQGGLSEAKAAALVEKHLLEDI